MRRAALVLAFTLAAAAPAAAQVPVGGVFRVDDGRRGLNFWSNPGIGRDGSFVVVWSSYQYGGRYNEVFGRRYSPDGVALGAQFQVNTYTTGNQGGPHLAMLPDGAFVVAFQNDYHDSIWARRYDAAGNPRGPDFQVSTVPVDGGVPWVAGDPSGGFVVVWQAPDGDGHGIFGRRYDRAGEALGAAFQVNTYTTAYQSLATVAVGGSGAFTVAWTSALGDGDGKAVRARRFDAAGAPLGADFRVNSFTFGDQSLAGAAMDRDDNAIVAWTNMEPLDGSFSGVYAQRYDAAGAPRGGEFRLNASTTDSQLEPTVSVDEGGNFVAAWTHSNPVADTIEGRRFDAQAAPRGGDFVLGPVLNPFYQYDAEVVSDRRGNFIASWTHAITFEVLARRYGWIFPGQLRVDPAPSTTSDGNQLLEPCERVRVQPGWRNRSAGAETLTGTAMSFTGPAGPTYLLRDATASYGAVAVGALGLCATGGDCYEVEIPCPAARPLTHWDAELLEKLAPDAQGQTAAWRVHVGESFTDMPRSSPFYLWVEALLHNNVTGGCTATQYCGAQPTTREQMAVFLVSGRAGPYYAPPSCQGAPVFGDVPISSPYCRWIEELARFGVTGGCGNGNFCPGANVLRQEMAVFVLRTAEPGFVPPACGTPVFSDVPASSPYCRWIEELVRRGVVTGCGGGRFCPNDAVTREQMAVFIVLTFGLGIYEP